MKMLSFGPGLVGKRILDGGMDLAVEQKTSRPVIQSAGEKVSRNSDPPKESPREDIPAELLRDAQSPGL